MSSFGKWWGRLSAVLGAVVLSVFVPVAAWASTGTGELVVEAARRRRGGGFGVLGAALLPGGGRRSSCSWCCG